MNAHDGRLLRRALALLIEFDDASIRVANFLTRRSAVVTPPVLAYLRDLAAPASMSDAIKRLPDRPGLLDRLIESTLILRVGSAPEIEDRQWADTWRFGAPAAAAHFARRSAVVIEAGERAQLLRSAAAGITSVPLSVRHPEPTATLALPPVRPDAGIALVMAQRRSARRFTAAPVSQDVLSQVLFALVGLTGRIDDPVLGVHPLSLSPSGGARNPYEAYLCVHMVDDLCPGTFHYDQSAQTLLRLGDRSADLATLAGGQEWAAEAAFVVILVAYLDRVWSKYPTPAAYHNVLIEAGHRAQNALLIATECRLTARMTTAIDATADDILGLRTPNHSPVYLLAFGHPEGAS